ncbi:anti-sigma regulatory factor [Streptomyces sp. NPDC048521]|uniref:anti-sigma regulatory factor n=1 Tax=Streptomyces sp. NPDC048521 TaxID=3365566 RepID=UPI00371A6B87
MPAPDPTARTSLPIGCDEDLPWVRHRVRRFAAGLGFGLVQQTKLVTAASELARNTLLHGGGGQVEVTSLADGPRRGLRLAFIDTGPGIRDVELAMTDGYSSACGLGLGLGGAKRLVDDFTLDTRPGRGAVVTVVAWVTGEPTARAGPG